MSWNDTPWDIYVDERKVVGDYALGFLIIPNTASFLHKLWLCRHRTEGVSAGKFVAREIHWNAPHLDSLEVAVKWIDLVFQHRGARFFLETWPEGDSKQMVILRFLSRFCRRKKLLPPHNVVVFLDFDCDHAKAKIQNNVREVGNICRCYHLDSLNNDCLQCCDLLLGATATLGNNPIIRMEYEALMKKYQSSEKLKDSEVKKIIAGYLAKHIDANGSSVYDRRIKVVKKTTDSK